MGESQGHRNTERQSYFATTVEDELSIHRDRQTDKHIMYKLDLHPFKYTPC